MDAVQVSQDSYGNKEYFIRGRVKELGLFILGNKSERPLEYLLCLQYILQYTIMNYSQASGSMLVSCWDQKEYIFLCEIVLHGFFPPLFVFLFSFHLNNTLAWRTKVGDWQNWLLIQIIIPQPFLGDFNTHSANQSIWSIFFRSSADMPFPSKFYQFGYLHLVRLNSTISYEMYRGLS